MIEPVVNETTHWWNGWWCKPIRVWLRRVGFFFVLYVLSTGPLYWKWYEAQYLEGPVFYAVLFFPITKACEFEFVRNFFDWYVGWWI